MGRETGGVARRFSGTVLLAAFLRVFVSVAAGAEESPFRISAELGNADGRGELRVAADFPEDGHLYADNWSVTVNGARQENGTLPTVDEDGMPVMKRPFSVSFPLPDGTNRFLVEVSYMGCAGTTCYMPRTERFDLSLGGSVPQAGPDSGPGARGAEDSGARRAAGFRVFRADGYLPAGRFLRFLDSAKAPGAAEAPAERGASGVGGWALRIAALVAGGFLLNLTPCVLPMIPVQLAVLGIGKRRKSKRDGFRRGLVFGSGMAAAYGVLGAVAVATGAVFGALQSSAWFNLAVALVFVALAAAQLDCFAIDFSRFRKTRSDFASDAAVFSAGVFSALLAGACVAPVVISTVLSAGALYAGGHAAAVLLPLALGAGMALPWPFVGAGIGALPKPGPWMRYVKFVFAAVMLAFVFHYGRLAYAGFFPERAGTAAGDPGQRTEFSASDATVPEKIGRLAGSGEKPVLLDFWATWCKNCGAMERSVFKDPGVAAALEDFVVVRIQAEDPRDPATAALLETYGVKGLPAFRILAAP